MRTYLLLLCLLLPLSLLTNLAAQCLMYPVELEDRVDAAETIVLGKLIDQHGYYDAKHQGIYTLNTLEVTAYLKGQTSSKTVGVITVGGLVGNRAQISHPSLSLAPWNEYVIFLAADNFQLDDPALRQSQPQLLQALTVADAQGAITKQSGIYHDLLAEPEHTEASLFRRIEKLTGTPALTPKGTPFSARSGDTYPLSEWSGDPTKAPPPPITTFNPNPTNAGTIAPADFITIDGSGFGGTAGTVFYTNADDGGATLTASGVASDNLAWSDTQIQNKPAGAAGTGPISVNGTINSATDLTINYAHIDINSSFASHAATERQAYKHVDKNGTGGYTYSLNTAFAANAPAAAAFDRALETWTCETNINMEISGTTTATAAVGTDGENVVFFNGALPAGVLGRANSLITASATGACNLFNTVWWVDEIDIEFRTDPPAGCCTWNFGPAASAFLEFDFESVALHELGHAHGLGHVIAPGTVMHFALANGSDTRSLSANDIAGANAKMTHNAIPLCFNPAGVNGNMVPVVPATCAILPIQQFSLDAKRIDASSVGLDWTFTDGTLPLSWEVQRSTNGIEFQSIGWVSREDAKGSGHTFSYEDLTAASGADWWYRIRFQTADGGVASSEVAHITAEAQVSLVLFPTLVTDELTLRGTLPEATTVSLSLFDLTGRELSQQVFPEASGAFEESIEISGLPKGVVLYRMMAQDQVYVGKLILD